MHATNDAKPSDHRPFKVYRFAEYLNCPSHVPFGRLWLIRSFVLVGDPRRIFGNSPWEPRYDARLLYIDQFGGLTPEEIWLAEVSGAAGLRQPVDIQMRLLAQISTDADARERAVEFVRRIAR
jgi:hypothetical protein